MPEQQRPTMQDLINALQEEVLDHLHAGHPVQLMAHGEPLGPLIESRPTPLADLRTIQLLARGHSQPLTTRGLITTQDAVAAIAQEKGHTLRWGRWEDESVMALCTNRGCIGHIYVEDGGTGEKWSGSLLWKSCPVTIPMALTPEQAGAMWDEES